MAPRRVAAARQPAAKPAKAKAVPRVSAAAAKALLFVESVLFAAGFKGELDSLSVPTELKEKMKRTAFGDLCQLLFLLAAASTSRSNPLRKADRDHAGAFVGVNHRNELPGALGGYLFMFAISFLHSGRSDLPPVSEYGMKKDEHTTPWRWSQEERRLFDPAAQTHCPVFALVEALKARFGFQLQRRPHTIFLYSKSSKAGLVSIDFVALLGELKSQAPLPLMPGLTQRTTVPQMCDMLLAPFKTILDDELDARRAELDAINHAPRAWPRFTAALGKRPGAQKARTALIKQLKAAEKVVREAKLRAEAAAKPPSRSGKRKAATDQEAKLAKKAKLALSMDEEEELEDDSDDDDYVAEEDSGSDGDDTDGEAEEADDARVYTPGVNDMSVPEAYRIPEAPSGLFSTPTAADAAFLANLPDLPDVSDMFSPAQLEAFLIDYPLEMAW